MHHVLSKEKNGQLLCCLGERNESVVLNHSVGSTKRELLCNKPFSPKRAAQILHVPNLDLYNLCDIHRGSRKTAKSKCVSFPMFFAKSSGFVGFSHRQAPTAEADLFARPHSPWGRAACCMSLLGALLKPSSALNLKAHCLVQSPCLSDVLVSL